MSPVSQPNLFSKQNLVYIPLSITIAHILNFVVNSPLSTWYEFPPKLPNSVYSSICLTPLLLFISLTFEPIRTRKRFYVLLSLALIFLSIPISYRSARPSIMPHNFIVFFGTQIVLKMGLFLKFNRTYLNKKQSDQKGEFKSYLWTLFNFRFNSYIIPPNSQNSDEKVNPKSPTTSQINEKLIRNFIVIVAKWLIYELTLFISIKYAIEVPEKVYHVRLLELITKQIFPVTMSSMLRYLNFIVFIYM